MSEVAGFWRPPFALFSTRGEIYVDSPEVYTRERLVNDRYDQDHWLRRRLRALDDNPELVSRRISAGAVAALGEDSHPTGANPQSAKLNFAQQFEIASGIRDKIRQLMLENMLDDRHDLSGNSVWGFKFDTTVVPGDNTHSRAFVRMRTEIEPFFEIGDGPRRPDGNLPAYLAAALDTDGNAHEKLERYNEHYLSWLRSIESRLNNYVDSFYRYEDPDCSAGTTMAEKTTPSNAPADDAQRMDIVTLEALETLFSIYTISPQQLHEDLDQLNERIIQIPEPWHKFFQVVRKETETICGLRPRFLVREAFDTIYVFTAGENRGLPSWATKSYFEIRTVPEEDVVLAVGWDGQLNDLEEYDLIQPRYNFPDSLISEARRLEVLRYFCYDKDTIRPISKCPPERTVGALTLRSGLFNLIEQLHKQDAYSYAIFPRNDSEGVLTMRALQAGLSAGEGLGGLAVSSTEDRSNAKSVLVGFGDSRGADKKAIEFGWVMTPPDTGEPVQRTQMSLISVPAWANEIVFGITTGWLDREAREEEVETHQVRVPLPPDFEALDIVVWGGSSDIRRRPMIFERFMDPKDGHIELTACQPAEVLIPGSRLWRSTAVTIGGQRADRISVLPNMEGIIAEFEEIRVPGLGAAEASAPVQELVLRVWTSEGVATSKKGVRVRVPVNGPRSCTRRKSTPTGGAPPEPADARNGA